MPCVPSLTVTALFPPIEPYQSGMLEVGHGNLVYWETVGNPEGKPAVLVHGGPGSGTSSAKAHRASECDASQGEPTAA
jgi:hypothetical protein